ncbi:alpha/beta hydrolase [Salinibacterium sp. dk2585]|uniref:alpha/beta fold hydrolase n=1 Tax=unclassified Salinibacterium TaxID=2632331 RepID=UPI0011C2443B|nr:MULTISPECIES: alpha/beta hydrolase [unclassified Salinibacterium]QEE62005.1 alpha/beta hydrolase [Salinibacterium sp. dk2585]TXK54440.1 alpha/beta hydrolase [Salinibacterium sp. dk5596]
MTFGSSIRTALATVGLAPRPVLHVAGDVGEGPVVILVHGIASSSVTFQNLVPLLERDHRVISIDILGHGESPTPANAEYTIEEHVKWLQRTIKRLRIRDEYTIVGHSLGALIVSRFARVTRDRITKVVLVSPPVYLSPQEIADPIDRAAVGAYLRVYEYLRSHKEFTIKRAAVVARLMPIRDSFEITERNWRAFVLSLQRCIESQTTLTDIAAIRVPVEIIYGALDQFIIPGSMKLLKNMRNVTVRRVDLNDHIVRRRLAREIAAAIRGEQQDTDAAERRDPQHSEPPADTDAG